MKIEIELQYPLGTPLYGVDAAAKNLYAPCPTCGNTRKLNAVGIDKSAHSFDCPRCSNKATKGDTTKSIKIYTYTLSERRVESVSYAKNGVVSVENTRLSLSKLESMIKNTDNIQDYCCKSWGDDFKCNIGENFLSADKEHMEALIKTANKAEREKARAFEKEHALVG